MDPERNRQPVSPCIYVLLAGLPGTGKSTLATAVATRLNAAGHRAIVLNKDNVRAALFPGPATDYSAAQNSLCMDAMLRAATYLRRANLPPSFILFDGRTFKSAEEIDQVVLEANGNWSILHLICSDEVARARLETAAGMHVAADRDFALYQALKNSFQSIVRPHLVIDTGTPLSRCVEVAAAYLTQNY